MKEFEVLISRSAVETATIRVLAESQDDAESKVGAALDTTRVGLSDLAKKDWAARPSTWERSCSGDEESSWEIC